MSEEEIKATYLWNNMRTGKVDALEETPSAFEDYIPQNGAAQGLYRILLKQGMPPLLAAIHVLKVATGMSSEGTTSQPEADDE